MNDLPVIEALCKATGSSLQPIEFHYKDSEQLHLEIWYHKNDEDFQMKLSPFVPADEMGNDADLFFQHLEKKPIVPTFTAYGGKKLKRGDKYDVWYSDQYARQLFSRIPEAKPMFINSSNAENVGCYKVAATDFSALIIHHAWPKDRIVFRNEDCQTHYEYLLVRFFGQSARANMQAKFKIDKVVPDDPPDYLDHEERPLADYQKVGVLMGLMQEATGLFMDRGTGKTCTSIARICTEARRTHKKYNRMMRVLVVCPNAVRLNWQEEFRRFATVAGKVTIIRGDKNKRIQQFTEGVKRDPELCFSTFVVGYGSIASDIDILYTLFEWDLVILDESHCIKSTTTGRFKAAIAIRDSSARRQILTGTPTANSFVDIFAQLEFLGRGLSGFTSLREFKKFYGKYVKDSDDRDILTGMCNVPLFQERLARLSYSVTKEEAGLNLPDKVYGVVEVAMTRKQAELYENLKESLVAEIEAEAGRPNSTITADNILTRLMRLAQITSGYCKTDGVIDPFTSEVLEKGQVYQINPEGENPKIISTMELLAESPEEEKTVIWCCFREDIQQLCKALTKAEIVHGHYYGDTSEQEREDNVQKFNNDEKFRVLIANPQSAGEGLNLLGHNPDRDDQETYCGHEIFFSQNWSYILRAQAEDRAHRRGTKMPVKITDLQVIGTIDEEIRNRVTLKKDSAAKREDVSQILQNILNLDMSGSLL